ncbi:hypothetical protein QOZ80_6AG0537140 [Eleusine coracana subsp. coracana]|nr:hypothetical protein QOZ80_6AG0537140 [Eleusine coracana subsp. coracana]
MPLKKRGGGGDGRRSSNQNKRTCYGAGETPESVVTYQDSQQGVWSELSDQAASVLTKSVVSIALSDGHKVLFASSGIAIHCQADVSNFLTSASLVRALHNEAKYHDSLKIEVLHEGNVVIGFLDKYDLDYEIAIVKVTSFLDVNEVFLSRALKFVLGCNVVAAGRDTYGKLMATSGNLTSNPSRSEDSECLMFSTCKLLEALEGGPLFDFHGNLIGMNLFSRTGISLFVPVSLIIERLEHFRTSQQRTVFLDCVKDLKPMRVAEKNLCSHPEGNDTQEQEPDFQKDTNFQEQESLVANTCVDPAPRDTAYLALRYPRPSTNYFGDIYPKGVWSQFHKRVSRRISRNVVSLASFNGNTRFFACTGFFIDWDECQDKNVSTILTSATLVRNSDPSAVESKIFDGLRIEVLLPKGKRTGGKLMHYNLHYNVALVCDLMASRGKLVGWSGSLDCKILQYSTCKITKAGIGGPLVDIDGNFIGMNFYDPKMGTPALLHDDILRILEGFKEKCSSNRNRTPDCTYGDDAVRMNRWPLPQREPHFEEYEHRVLASGCQYKYRFGEIHLCK